MTHTDLLAAIQQRNPAQVATAIGRGTQPTRTTPVATRRSTSPSSPPTHRLFAHC